jgi:hypothetical protein
MYHLIFNLIAQSRSGQNLILLVPLMRYARRPCCSDPSHVVNKCESSYSALMGEVLIEIRSWLHGLAFTRRIRNFAVICLNELLVSEDSVRAGIKQMKKYWKSDPVHMTEQGYEDLARLLLEQIMETELSRKLEKKEANSATEVDRKVVNWSARRSDCVLNNDASVHQQYSGEDRGEPHGSEAPHPAGAGEASTVAAEAIEAVDMSRNFTASHTRYQHSVQFILHFFLFLTSYDNQCLL